MRLCVNVGVFMCVRSCTCVRVLADAGVRAGAPMCVRACEDAHVPGCT